ncbi:MAG: hypothetical protein K2X03_03900 [Bryobacteraceae bacterium]|nr:hypothetical protein [Bryobacteraceae bacterium]
MRIFLLFAGLATLPAFALNLTVLLDVEQKHSQRALVEMRKELAKVFKPTHLTVDVRLRQDAPANETYNDVVLVKLKGTCQMSNLAPLMDERGPFAFTHTVDGKILPFSEVACDHIARSVQQAMGGHSFDRERLLGRALARVLAHEIVHMVGQCADHSHAGVFRHALSGRQLVADKLELQPEDIARLP